MPNISFTEYKLNFFQRFVESHLVMFNGNAGLKPKEGEMTSRPWMWPINLKVIVISMDNVSKNCGNQNRIICRVNFSLPVLKAPKFTCWAIRLFGGAIWF